MQALKDFVKHLIEKFDLMQYCVGFFVMGLMGAVAYSIMFRAVPVENKELFIHLIGIVEGAFVGGIVQYYYGKSKNDKPAQ